MEETDWKDKYTRLLSDFENYKRNKNKELTNSSFSGRKEMALKLIPFLDDLENLFKYNRHNHNIMALYNNYLNTLDELGLTYFGEAGDVFNEELHQAVSISESGDVPVNCISVILKRGYRLDDEIIRYASVIVEK